MKRIFTFLFVIIITGVVAAQPAFLSITNNRNENFWVNINNYPINEQSTESITITNLNINHTYCVEIIFNNQEYNTVTTTLKLNPGFNNFIISYHNQNKMGTFEPTHRAIQAMMIVTASNTVQQSVPNSNLTSNTPYNGQSGQPRPNGYYNYPNNPVNPNNPYHPNNPSTPSMFHPYSEPEFMVAFHNLEELVYDTEKLDLAKQVVSARPILTSQIVRITQLMSFENTKLDFLKYAYRFCYDKQNYYLTYSLLSFTSSRKELITYISAFNNQ